MLWFGVCGSVYRSFSDICVEICFIYPNNAFLVTIWLNFIEFHFIGLEHLFLTRGQCDPKKNVIRKQKLLFSVDFFPFFVCADDIYWHGIICIHKLDFRAWINNIPQFYLCTSRIFRWKYYGKAICGHIKHRIIR